MTTLSTNPNAHPGRGGQGRRWLWGIRQFVVHAIAQDRVLKRIYPGVMHLLIFWGMTIQILGTVLNLVQYPLFLPFEIPFPKEQAYLGFELVMDLAGGMIILGVLMAMFRRAVLRPKYLVSRWEDWYVLVLLLVIPILGFLSEAVRLQAADTAWRAWSPIGNLLASALAAGGLTPTIGASLHAYFFWAHVSTGLLFVASLPFTKLRHLVTGPLSIVSRPKRDPAALKAIDDIENAETLGVGDIGEFESQALVSFDACVQCGRCEDVCPASFSGMPYSPRELIGSLQDSVHTSLASPAKGASNRLLGGTLDMESPWHCTTCGACVAECPMFIDQVGTVVELRRYLTLTTGEVPGSVGEALTQIERRGNPWGLPKENRSPWVSDLGLRVLQPGDETDVLLFVGCAYNYDSAGQRAGKALAKLLQRGGLQFATLGPAEVCCGETARRLGHEYLFQVMAEENLAALSSVRFERIVAPCAHCYSTLRNEYPQFGAEFKVVHHTELLAELLDEGRLELNGAADDALVTYHDSCYLGRYNQLYDPPRRALDSVPGLRRVEMPRNRANAFCCGGGGGQMWLETDPNTRINHRRLAEAFDQANANTVITACPYCLIMFDDAIRSKGLVDRTCVKDVAELLLAHIGDGVDFGKPGRESLV